MSMIRNPQLAQEGEARIEWASAHMPLLSALEKEYKKTQPLKGKKVAAVVDDQIRPESERMAQMIHILFLRRIIPGVDV